LDFFALHLALACNCMSPNPDLLTVLREEAFIDRNYDRLPHLASRYFYSSDGGGNACYKLTGALGGAKVSGPILVEICKDNNVFQRNCDVESAFNMASLAVIDAQENQRTKPLHGKSGGF